MVLFVCFVRVAGFPRRGLREGRAGGVRARAARGKGEGALRDRQPEEERHVRPGGGGGENEKGKGKDMDANDNDSGGKKYMSDPNAYDRWKTLVPYLYDFFTNHKLYWPALSCRYQSIKRGGFDLKPICHPELEITRIDCPCIFFVELSQMGNDPSKADV